MLLTTKNNTEKKRFQFDNVYMQSPIKYGEILVFQIGDLSTKSGFECGLHEQVCYEISCIVNGKGYFFVDGIKYEVEKGDIFINLLHQMHSIKSDNDDPFRYLYIGFNFKFDSIDSSLNHVKRAFDCFKKPFTKDKFNISNTFFSLLRELKNPDMFSHQMIRNYIEDIIIMSCRNFSPVTQKNYAFANGISTQKEIVYSAVNYIDNNISDIKELKDISEILGYSYTYLSHVFSNEIGLSLQAYYSKKRLEKAIDLIRNGKNSMTQISEMLNFQTVHSFSRAFKQEIGLSPSEYKKLLSKYDISNKAYYETKIDK